MSRGKVCEALRRARPDIVLTAPPVDYMTDHELTSVLVREACFSASVPNYSTRQWSPAKPLGGIPHLYYVDSVEGTWNRGRIEQDVRTFLDELIRLGMVDGLG